MKTKDQHLEISPITFKTRLSALGEWTVLRLPESASEKLPSRGQVMVKGTINDHDLQQVLEPDGRWGHWFKVSTKLQKTLGVKAGDIVTLNIAPSKDWPEPHMSPDF